VIHRLELSFALLHFVHIFAERRVAPPRPSNELCGRASTRHGLVGTATASVWDGFHVEAHVATEEWWEWNGVSTTTVGRSPRRFVRPGREPALPARLESRAG